MNWVLKKSKKYNYQTDLAAVLKPLDSYVDRYNWFITDVEYIDLRAAFDSLLPINLDEDYFILSPSDFRKLLSIDLQIIWGVVLAIPKDLQIEANSEYLPFVEGNDAIWQEGNIQLPGAEVEIDCFDSSYTIVKFSSEELSAQFKCYFEEAIPLAKFKG